MDIIEARGARGESRRFWIAVVVACGAVAVGCGKKGPPLAPLNLVPDKPAGITARVVDDTVYIHTFVPSKNANGPGAPSIDRVELYAVTLDKGAVAPANRDLLLPSRVIARVAVKPPVDPDAPVDESAPRDTRPGAGDPVSFAETLAAAQRVPDIRPVAPTQKSSGETTGAAASTAMVTPPVETPGSPDAVPAGGAASGTAGTAGLPGGAATGISAAFLLQLPEAGPLTAPGTAAAAPSPAVVLVPTRLYVVRGVTKKGRGGTPSPRVLIDLEPPAPPPPTAPAAAFTESAIAITWRAPAEAGTVKYNVYDAEQAAGGTAAPAPLNAAPLDATTFDRPGAEPGVERCFVVRSVQTRDSVDFESVASPRVCVTPRDIFPPAAPKALAAVAGAGAVNLIWDANEEADVAGYVVLRGDAPGDTLQPLMAQPIRETRYLDTTATPGVQYVYVVVAVDKAGNRSANSNRVTETAR